MEKDEIKQKIYGYDGWFAILCFIVTLFFAMPSKLSWLTYRWFESLFLKYHEPLSYYVYPDDQISVQLFLILSVLAIVLLLVLLGCLYRQKFDASFTTMLVGYCSTAAWVLMFENVFCPVFDNGNFEGASTFLLILVIVIQTVIAIWKLYYLLKNQETAKNGTWGPYSFVLFLSPMVIAALVFLGYGGLNVPRRIVLDKRETKTGTENVLRVSNIGPASRCLLDISGVGKNADEHVTTHFVIKKDSMQEFGVDELKGSIHEGAEGFVAVEGFKKRIGFKFLYSGGFSTWSEKAEGGFDGVPFEASTREAKLGGLVFEITNLEEHETLLGLVAVGDGEEKKTKEFSISPKGTVSFGKLELLRSISPGDKLIVELAGFGRRYSCEVKEDGSVVTTELEINQ